MSYVGAGEESCIFRLPDGRHVISVLKENPSDATAQRLQNLHIVLLEKDPEQKYFVSGRLTRMSMGDFQSNYQPDLESCDASFGSNIWFSVMPKLQPLGVLPYGLSAAQKQHLRRGLELLHGPLGLPLAHGDIKSDNIMLRGEMPVFIDFGHSRPISGPNSIHEINAERDNQNLDSFLNEPPPVFRRARRSRSRSRGSPARQSPNAFSRRSRSPRSPGSPKFSIRRMHF